MTRIVIRCFLLLISFVYTIADGIDVNLSNQDANIQSVSVSVHKASCDHQGKPFFDWVITNTEKKPVYIYSTFLKGPAASRSFEESSHVYTIWTSLPEKADYSVNDYPSAKFVTLNPGAVLRGKFVEYPQHLKPCAKCGKLPKSATNIAFAVAFGWSIESVEAELRSGQYVHPANPIVQWQQITKSVPVPLDSCSLK